MYSKPIKLPSFFFLSWFCIFILFVASQVNAMEVTYPPFEVYNDELGLSKISMILGMILGLSIILYAVCYGYFSIKLMILAATAIFNVAFYYGDHSRFTILDEKEIIKNPEIFFIYYLPVYIASACLQHEKSDFVRVLPYAFLTASLIILMAFITGYILIILTTLKWSYFQMFVFGVSTCSCEPDVFGKTFKHPRFAKLNLLTKGEYIWTMILSLSIVELYMDDKITDFPTFLAFFMFDSVYGIVLGLLAGFLIASTLWLTKDDTTSCFLIILSSMISLYFFAIYATASPALAAFSMVPPLYRYRKHFSKEANDVIIEYFHMTHLLVDILVYTYLVHLAIDAMVNGVYGSLKYSYCIFGFVCNLFFRAVIYLCLSPIIRRMSSELDTVAIVVNSWATITSTAALVISFMFFFDDRRREFGLIVIGQITFSIVCTNIISPVATFFLKVNKFANAFTPDQLSNVQACLQEIRSLRVKYIYMWKMKGIMTDARWDLVKSCTNISHSKKNQMGTSSRSVTCPDCGREIQLEAAERDTTDYTSVSRKLIKNQMKTILTRKHQFGYISHNGIKVCMNIIDSCLTFDKHVHHDLFRSLMQPGSIRERLYKWEQSFFTGHDIIVRIPRKRHRAILFHFTKSATFTWLALGLGIYSFMCIMLSMFIDNFDDAYYCTVMILSQLYIIVQLAQMYIFMSSYSIFSFRGGMRSYFESIWHRIEAASLAFAFVDLIVCIVLFNSGDIAAWHSYKYVRLLKGIEALSTLKIFTPKIIRSMEEYLVGRISLGYEVSKAVFDAYSELELSLDFIFDDNILLATECEKWVREDKQHLYEIMSYVQYNYPNISRNVKTRQVVNSTLTVMNITLEQIKLAGYVDIEEYLFIKKRLRSCESRGKILEKSYQAISPRDIFQNISWINRSETVIQDYLWSVCTTKTLLPGEVLYEAGHKGNGIYVVISGMLQLDYVPTNELLSNMLKYGLLPVFKYSDCLQFFEPLRQTIVVGNTIGEMGEMCQRPNDVTIVAVKPTKLYHIHHDQIQVAERFMHNPADGIIAQMWKLTCFNVATAILKAMPKYEFYTQQDIRMKVETAFVPDLSCYKMFFYLDAIDDLILLHGAVRDHFSGMLYVAPCYIPRSVIKLSMHEVDSLYSDSMPPFDYIEARLMIIPMQDIDKNVLMEMEDEVADLMPGATSKYAFRNKEAQYKIGGTGLSAFYAMKPVTQGSHLSRFINLKK